MVLDFVNNSFVLHILLHKRTMYTKKVISGGVEFE